jgi:hypothetical protein
MAPAGSPPGSIAAASAEQDLPSVVADDGTDSGQHQQIVADTSTKASDVGRNRHGVDSSDHDPPGGARGRRQLRTSDNVFERLFSRTPAHPTPVLKTGQQRDLRSGLLVDVGVQANRPSAELDPEALARSLCCRDNVI